MQVKKMVSLILVLAMFTTMVPAVFAAEESKAKESIEMESVGELPWEGVLQEASISFSLADYVLYGTVSTPGELQAALNDPLIDGKKIILEYSITLTSELTIPNIASRTTCNVAIISVDGPKSIFMNGDIRHINVNEKNTCDVFLTFDDVTLDGYHKPTFGGGIFSAARSLTLEGVKIKNCNKDGIVRSEGAVTINGGEISDNGNWGVISVGDAKVHGGAKINNNGGGIFSNGKVIVGGDLTTTINNNTSSSAGGGIYSFEEVRVELNGEVKNNTSPADGGGIYAEKNVTVQGGTVSGNKATSGKGGGLYSKTGNVYVQNEGSVKSNVNGNTAMSGGGVYAPAGAVLVTDSSVNENIATSTNTEAMGAGIYAGLDVTIQDSNVNGNILTSNSNNSFGGGIYTLGKVTVTRSNVNGNKTKTTSGNARGGGIYTQEVILNDGSIIESNEADTNGGGIYATSKVTANSNTKISKNKAAQDGAGIFCSNTAILNSGSTIDNNIAQRFGGGIYVISALEVNGATISANEANSGGGIYVHETPEAQWASTPGSVKVTPGSKITNNKANKGGTAVTDGNGGGIFTFRLDQVDIEEGVEFSGNEAKRDYNFNLTDPIIVYPDYNEIHATHVDPATTFSGTFTNLYNNRDVGYTRYSLDYRMNDGTGTEPATAWYPLRTGVTVAENMFERTGYTFIGWDTQANGTGTSYSGGDTIDLLTQGYALYAQWQINQYTVSFDANGGNKTMDSITQDYQTVITLPELGFDPPSHTRFLEWNTQADGKGTSYKPGDTFVLGAGDVTIFAIWRSTGSGGGAQLTPKEKPEIITASIISLDEFGNEIYRDIVPGDENSTITVKASTLLGYELDDEAEKSVKLYGWHENEVTFKYKKRSQVALELQDHIKYLNGYPNGTVKPDGNVTRAEVAAIFYRLIKADDKDEEYIPNFKDVPDGEWYTPAVNYLTKYGVITGYKDQTFKPNEIITRAEFAAIASRFDNLELVTTSAFPDVPNSHWASQVINSSAKKEWLSGFPDGRFMPEQGVTRVQVVTVINKMLGRKIRSGDIPESANEFSDLPSSYWGYADILEAATDHEYELPRTEYEIWK